MKPSLSTAATIFLVAAVFACATQSADKPQSSDASKSTAKNAAVQPESGERHFGAIRQLTFGGENAEAYFSYDGKRLVFMSTREPYKCDQIFTMNADGSDQKLESTGKGRTTCGFFYADGKHVLYSSTHEASAECPQRPDYSHGYV